MDTDFIVSPRLPPLTGLPLRLPKQIRPIEAPPPLQKRTSTPLWSEKRVTKDRRRQQKPVAVERRKNNRRGARKLTPPGVKAFLSNSQNPRPQPAVQSVGRFIDEEV